MFESMTLKDMKVGDTKSMEYTIDEEHVEAFAKATGDYNPIHVDREYAEKSQFGRQVVHGVLLTGIVSGLLGTNFPGLGTVAREMNAKFSGPVYIGDTVTITAEVTEIKEKLNMCNIKYYIRNSEGRIVVKGIAIVLPKRD